MSGGNTEYKPACCVERTKACLCSSTPAPGMALGRAAAAAAASLAAAAAERLPKVSYVAWPAAVESRQCSAGCESVWVAVRQPVAWQRSNCTFASCSRQPDPSPSPTHRQREAALLALSQLVLIQKVLNALGCALPRCRPSAGKCGRLPALLWRVCEQGRVVRGGSTSRLHC